MNICKTSLYKIQTGKCQYVTKITPNTYNVKDSKSDGYFEL
jgi:hypothetical protein